MSDDNTETIATYSADGATYEIDHLGILHDSQWGEFASTAPVSLPVTTAELVALARSAGEHHQAQDESIAAFMATQDARKTADPRLS